MLHDGIKIVEGAEIENLTVASGTLVERNALTPNQGEIFYQTDNTPGFYSYDGSAWDIFGVPGTIEGGVF